MKKCNRCSNSFNNSQFENHNCTIAIEVYENIVQQNKIMYESLLEIAEDKDMFYDLHAMAQETLEKVK